MSDDGVDPLSGPSYAVSNVDDLTHSVFNVNEGPTDGRASSARGVHARLHGHRGMVTAVGTVAGRTGALLSGGADNAVLLWLRSNGGGGDGEGNEDGWKATALPGHAGAVVAVAGLASSHGGGDGGGGGAAILGAAASVDGTVSLSWTTVADGTSVARTATWLHMD